MIPVRPRFINPPVQVSINGNAINEDNSIAAPPPPPPLPSRDQKKQENAMLSRFNKNKYLAHEQNVIERNNTKNTKDRPKPLLATDPRFSSSFVSVDEDRKRSKLDDNNNKSANSSTSTPASAVAMVSVDKLRASRKKMIDDLYKDKSAMQMINDIQKKIVMYGDDNKLSNIFFMYVGTTPIPKNPRQRDEYMAFISDLLKYVDKLPKVLLSALRYVSDEINPPNYFPVNSSVGIIKSIFPPEQNSSSLQQGKDNNFATAMDRQAMHMTADTTFEVANTEKISSSTLLNTTTASSTAQKPTTVVISATQQLPSTQKPVTMLHSTKFLLESEKPLDIKVAKLQPPSLNKVPISEMQDGNSALQHIVSEPIKTFYKDTGGVAIVDAPNSVKPGPISGTQEIRPISKIALMDKHQKNLNNKLEHEKRVDAQSLTTQIDQLTKIDVNYKIDPSAPKPQLEPQKIVKFPEANSGKFPVAAKFSRNPMALMTDTRVKIQDMVRQVSSDAAPNREGRNDFSSSSTQQVLSDQKDGQFNQLMKTFIKDNPMAGYSKAAGIPDIQMVVNKPTESQSKIVATASTK